MVGLESTCSSSMGSVPLHFQLRVPTAHPWLWAPSGMGPHRLKVKDFSLTSNLKFSSFSLKPSLLILLLSNNHSAVCQHPLGLQDHLTGPFWLGILWFCVPGAAWVLPWFALGVGERSSSSVAAPMKDECCPQPPILTLKVPDGLKPKGLPWGGRGQPCPNRGHCSCLHLSAQPCPSAAAALHTRSHDQLSYFTRLALMCPDVSALWGGIHVSGRAPLCWHSFEAKCLFEMSSAASFARAKGKTCILSQVGEAGS